MSKFRISEKKTIVLMILLQVAMLTYMLSFLGRQFTRMANETGLLISMTALAISLTIGWFVMKKLWKVLNMKEVVKGIKWPKD